MELRRESVFAGETEGALGASGVSPAVAAAGVPDPAVDAKPQRRRFTAEYKVRILREVDRAKEPGEVGTILRREGLYSSHLSVWRRDRDRVAKTDLVARKRGPKPKAVDPKIKQLERENAKLLRRNEHVELMLGIQKKVSELLGIPLKSLDNDESD